LFGSLESSCPGESNGVFNFILKSAKKAEPTLVLEIYALSGTEQKNKI